MRILQLRLKRKAVSTMIGGIIVLSLLLTALVAMIVVGQNYDNYQTIVGKMSQKDIDRFSESIVANYPGLYGNYTVASASCSGGKCTQYNMTLSNVGGISVQIVRVYVNSSTIVQFTGTTGCTIARGGCILNPSSTPAPYTFDVSQKYVGVGEITHNIRIWLPNNIVLPNPTPPSPQNTIWVATSRGRVFSFQWPFPPVGIALQANNPNIATGLMKIAYIPYSGNPGSNGPYSSALEGPKPNGNSPDYCHGETKEIVPGPSGNLNFVNPWINTDIMSNVASGSTRLYVYAKVSNTLGKTLVVSLGNIIIQTADASSNSKQFFMGGPYVGGTIVGSGTFVASPSSLTIQPNQQAILIFQLDIFQKQFSTAPGDTFSGTAAVNNNRQDGNYFAAEVFLDGLYNAGSC